MCVWISGFFGSESYFLKILSYLLANKLVGDRKAIDYFVNDKKVVDKIVLSDMKLAADTDTDVVLFNIDSKSDGGSKQNKDAIVHVFLKVFNEMQDFDFIQDDVVQVLAEMDFMSEEAARNWCEKAAEPYQISIEDFAKRVKAYIDQRGNNHHILIQLWERMTLESS